MCDMKLIHVDCMLFDLAHLELLAEYAELVCNSFCDTRIVSTGD